MIIPPRRTPKRSKEPCKPCSALCGGVAGPEVDPPRHALVVFAKMQSEPHLAGLLTLFAERVRRGLPRVTRVILPNRFRPDGFRFYPKAVSPRAHKPEPLVRQIAYEQASRA